MLKSLDLPVSITIAIGITSLWSGRNIFADELWSFIACFIGAWGISFLVGRYESRKAAAAKNAGRG